MHEWNNAIFKAFLVTDSGIRFQPVVSSTGSVHSGGTISSVSDINVIGQMKISPNGEKLALVQYQKNLAEIFHFNAASGTLDLFVTLLNFSDFNQTLYGVEFSPSSQFVYFTDSFRYIYQFDLSSSNIQESKVAIDNGYTYADDMQQLQLAPDGKIYVSRYANISIGAIELPDKKGRACRYTNQIVTFPVGNSRSSLQGLPNFISTYLYKPDLYPPPPIFEMPNVFTPNHDYINDIFTPINFYYIKDISLNIYNRWGQLIYNTMHIENGWRAEGVPSGIYYWQASYTGINKKHYIKKGVVQVLN